MRSNDERPRSMPAAQNQTDQLPATMLPADDFDAEDDERPRGRARRFEHKDREAFMAAHATRAQATPRVILDKFDLYDVLTYWPNVKNPAVPRLTGAEVRLLTAYVSVIPPEDIIAGKPMGSLSIAMLKAKLGIVERRIRALRASLEAKLLAWRSYNGANHQAAREGFDLAPLLDIARLVYAELQAGIDAVYARREVNNTITDMGGMKRQGTRTNPLPQIQTSPTPLSGAGGEVQEDEAESGWTPDKQYEGRKRQQPTSNTRSGGNTESCSAGRASVGLGRHISPVEEAAIARGALAEARRHSKSLRAAIPVADIDNLKLETIFASIARALPSLDPTFPVKTWEWAVREVGWRAVAALGVTLDDPTIGARVPWFAALIRGKFEIRDGYASNFRRMLRAEENAALETAAVERPRSQAPAEAPKRSSAEQRRLDAAVRYVKLEGFQEEMRLCNLARERGGKGGPAHYWLELVYDLLPEGWDDVM